MNPETSGQGISVPEEGDPRRRAALHLARTLYRYDVITLAGGTVAMGATIGPALALTGFMPEWGLDLWILCLIAALGGAVGFSVYYIDRRHWYLGIVPGLVTGPLILFATMAYAALRSEIFGLELVVPMVVGAIPGYWLWRYWLWRALVRDMSRRSGEGQDKDGGNGTACPEESG